MNELLSKKCKACEGGVNPLMGETLKGYLKQVPGWGLDETSRKVIRTWTFRNFAEAMAFLNKVAGVAEAENHHPDISLTGWNKVTLTLSTHVIGGLTENDFIVAAKINTLTTNS